MDSPFLGKHALVTGSTRGIGRAIAVSLLSAGARVVINGYHDPEKGQASLEELRKLGPVSLFLADVTEQAPVRLMIEDAVQVFGPIDYLVHTVGVIEHRPWDAWEEADWTRALRINLISGWLVAKEAVGWMADGGAILFLASTSSERVELDALPYSVAKAGLLTLARGLAATLAPRLRVNALSPGYIETGFDPVDHKRREMIEPVLPLHRFGTAQDVARAAISLLENPFITGQLLSVDGGESLL